MAAHVFESLVAAILIFILVLVKYFYLILLLFLSLSQSPRRECDNRHHSDLHWTITALELGSRLIWCGARYLSKIFACLGAAQYIC